MLVLVLVLVALLCATGVVGQFTCTMSLEAESGRGGTEMHRSFASGKRTALLREGEEIIFELQLHISDVECSMELVSLTYSNDGDGDIVEVFINKHLIKSFESYAESNNGSNWNKFRTKTVFSSKSTVSISNGLSTLRVLAANADSYGVEIDKLSLELDCPLEQVSVVADCSQDVVSVEEEDTNEESSTLSNGEIIAIVFGITSFVTLGIPTFCVGFVKFFRWLMT